MKTKNWIRYGLLLAMMGVFSAQASAISVNPLRVDFMPQTVQNQSTALYQDLTVTNVSKDIDYVEVSVSKVVNPGYAKEQLIPFQNNPGAFGLVASVDKLVIPAGQFRVVRLLRIDQSNTQDVVYLVHITPVLPPLLVARETATDENAIQAGLRIIVAYDVYAILLPQHPNVKVSLVREGQTLTVKNEGNTYVMLTHINQCNAQKKQCQSLDEKRLYVGNVWSVKLPYQTPVSLTVYGGGHTTVMSSN